MTDLGGNKKSISKKISSKKIQKPRKQNTASVKPGFNQKEQVLSFLSNPKPDSKSIIQFKPYNKETSQVMEEYNMKPVFELVAFSNRKMISVFKHLEKKWKVIVDNAHEISLFPSSRNTNHALYQHNCNDISIQEFCGRMESITVVFYRWENYTVDTEPLVFEELVSKEKQREEKKNAMNEDSFLSTSFASSQVTDVNDSILSSTSLSWDSQGSGLDENEFYHDCIDIFPLELQPNISLPVHFDY